MRTGSTLRATTCWSAMTISARDDERVDDQVRGGGVAASAGDADGEVVLAGHHRPGPGVQAAGRDAGQVVDAVERVDREALEEPVVDHAPGRPGRAPLRAGSMTRTVPSNPPCSARRAAAPRSIARWPSWPQACIVPGWLGGVLDAAVLGDRQARRARSAVPTARPDVPRVSEPTRPVPPMPGHHVVAEVAQYARRRTAWSGAPRTRSPGSGAGRGAMPRTRAGQSRVSVMGFPSVLSRTTTASLQSR